VKVDEQKDELDSLKKMFKKVKKNSDGRLLAVMKVNSQII